MCESTKQFRTDHRLTVKKNRTIARITLALLTEKLSYLATLQTRQASSNHQGPHTYTLGWPTLHETKQQPNETAKYFENGITLVDDVETICLRNVFLTLFIHVHTEVIYNRSFLRQNND